MMAELIALDMTFGSTSDRDKVMPGIEAFVKDYPDTVIHVHWASADNTPDKVAEIARDLTSLDPVPIISGAGMSNVLTGVMKTHATTDYPIIGVPIFDSVTRGLSSIFSTVEKPPRNVVMATGLNNSYAAANIAYKYLMHEYSNLAIICQPDTHPERQEASDHLVEHCMNYHVKNYQLCLPELVSPDDVVIFPFFVSSSHDYHKMLRLDRQLSEGDGIQIGVMTRHPLSGTDFERTLQYFTADLKSTVFVASGEYINAILAAAQLMDNELALGKFRQERQQKAEKLAAEPPEIMQYER